MMIQQIAVFLFEISALLAVLSAGNAKKEEIDEYYRDYDAR